MFFIIIRRPPKLIHSYFRAAGAGSKALQSFLVWGAPEVSKSLLPRYSHTLAHLPPGWGEPVILPDNSQLALLWNTTASKIHRPAEMRYGQSLAAHTGPKNLSAHRPCDHISSYLGRLNLLTLV